MKTFPRFLVLWVAAGSLAFCAWALDLPVGKGPAGPPVPKEVFKEAWTDRKILLVGIGDSVTKGFGSSKGHSYFERLVANPSDEDLEMKGICLSKVLPKLEPLNLSVSGSTSLQHAKHQVPKLKVQPREVFGVVVMTTGGNDLIHDYGRGSPKEGAMYGATPEQGMPWVETFERRLDGMLDGIEKAFPGGCLIFLADIYDPTDGEGDLEHAGLGLPAWKGGLALLQAYNEVIVRCAGRHKTTHVVGMHDAFLGHGIHCAERRGKHYCERDPAYWYFENLEDPNDRGYDAIRRAFLIEIAKGSGEIR